MRTAIVRGVPHTYQMTAPTDYPHVLVFIHGWLLSRRYWKLLVDRLLPSYQCLTYDLRGFGDSQATTSLGSVNPGSLGYNPAAYAQDLALLLDQLEIKSVWLVGHSLGGTIALWAANLFADRVRGVICLNSGGGIYLKEDFERFRNAGKQLLKVRPRWLCHLPLVDLLFARTMVAHPISRDWGRVRLLDFVGAQSEAALGTLMDSTTEGEVNKLPQIVAQLEQPVYFIAGQKDPVMELRYVRHLASFHPMFYPTGSNVVEVPDCGHLAMLEQPDRVSACIRDILSRFAP